MSADNQLEFRISTDDGPMHAMALTWAAKVREQPAIRTTRESVIAAIKHDPKMAEAIEALKTNIPAGSVVWITAAESLPQQGTDGPAVSFAVRFG